MNKISNAIKCVNCRNILVSPVLLPCGCSVCEKHTRNITGSTMLCCACEIDHPMPSNGIFPPNTALVEIIDAQFGEMIDFGPEHAEAKEACTRLNELLVNIDDLLNDPNHFTYDAIEYLKSVAQLKVEETKLKMDKDLARLVVNLDEFKADCERTRKSRIYATRSERFGREKEAARLEREKWMVTLNELKVNEPEWKKIKNKCAKAIEHLEDELAKFKRECLFEKRFSVYRADVAKVFGSFEIDPMFKFRCEFFCC
jgi:hypothetical protein